MNGYIKLYRQLQECWVWNADEKFSKGQAWVDLLLTANHKDKKILFDGELITIGRGQILTSLRKLSNKWCWSINTTKRFLNLLENDNMLIRRSDSKSTLLTIVNYENFQGMDFRSDTVSDTPTDTPSDTGYAHPLIHPLTPNNNVKNVKNDKNNISNTNVLDCPSEKPRNASYGWLIEAWNELTKYGIAPVKKITEGSKRLTNVRARVKQYGKDAMLEAIENIKTSDFLQGKHNGRPWQITFDWFVLPTNFPKVLEGNYNNDAGDRKLQETNNESAYSEYAKDLYGKLGIKL